MHEHTPDTAAERRIARNRDRYLRLLKDALHDRHYLDNEVRLAYIASLDEGIVPDPGSLRDPPRTMWIRYNRLAEARTAGKRTPGPRGDFHTPYADLSTAALDHLEAALLDVEDREVEGDIAEIGVGRGGGGIFLRGCLDAHDIADRDLYMIDTFLASTQAEPSDEPEARQRLRADLNQVRDGFSRFDLLDDRVRFMQGDYDSTLTDPSIGPFALVRVGVDAALTIGAVLGRIVPRMATGATLIVAGVARHDVGQRLAAFFDRRGWHGHLERVDWTTVAWRVTEAVKRTPTDTPSTDHALHRVPLAPRLDGDTLALSVIVVFYDMAREAARTLQSLTRSYQRGIGDVSYEVIAIDNGSHPDQRLDPADVASYGPEFRLITIEDAAPSPTVALNRGIAESRGEAVAVMIDGAHVLTPGVVRYALLALKTYPPAVVAVQQWYVGPGQQGDAQQAGYDQTSEDVLFQKIGWPTDGYRLFEIGHFIGDRDWFDGIIESNCLFVPRKVLEQVGGFDDSFDMPGGGYANLELFERLHSHPDLHPASILGEGTFHQFHGGTTTNVADEAIRRERIFAYGEHFGATRGRGLVGLSKPVQYVGAMDTQAARRTRSRREFQLAFDARRDPVSTTDRPPMPIAEELKVAAIEGIWQQQAWRDATWLGYPVARYPADLHSYQELIHQRRSDTVVLLGDDVGLGGRALFAASLGEGERTSSVVAVGHGQGPRPAHPSITYLDGAAEDPAIVQAVEKAVGDNDALVFIGLGAASRVLDAFTLYSGLVPIGGYAVIENTILNGRPVAPGFGTGPHEAVTEILVSRRDFVADVAFERYTVTFNKSGYLRRIASPS